MKLANYFQNGYNSSEVITQPMESTDVAYNQQKQNQSLY
jgi:hypothetical protein